jgi:hypothetical protein
VIGFVVWQHRNESPDLQILTHGEQGENRQPDSPEGGLALGRKIADQQPTPYRNRDVLAIFDEAPSAATGRNAPIDAIVVADVVGPLEQDENRDRAGPLDVATMRDIGARRDYQDYAPSARCPSLRGSAPPLHCRLGPVRITAVVFPARDGLRSATDFDATRLDDECEGPDIALMRECARPSASAAKRGC